jgi:hypothetical protein
MQTLVSADSRVTPVFYQETLPAGDNHRHLFIVVIAQFLDRLLQNLFISHAHDQANPIVPLEGETSMNSSSGKRNKHE